MADTTAITTMRRRRQTCSLRQVGLMNESGNGKPIELLKTWQQNLGHFSSSFPVSEHGLM